MKQRIVGRQQEQKILEKLYSSKSSEFVAVYGRRRVGKTFLVRECLEGKLTFSVSGLANSNKMSQLENFRSSLLRAGALVPRSFASWQEAFENLISFLSNSPRRRKVVFLDELPWMDTPKSDFISALEGFWNGWASGRHDILLIVCGSATSWMMNKLIKNHGGLHNRLTRQLRLQPFTLAETNKFLHRKNINISPYELAVCYMVFGGIPYYLNLLDASRSLSQNIDSLVFQQNGELHYEFDNLYASLFRNSQDYVKIVQALGMHREGMSRREIQEAVHFSSGGAFSTLLENLEHCGFIRQYSSMGAGRKTHIYQLVDFFTLFYLHFLKDNPRRPTDFWQSIQGTTTFYAWAGLTIELLVIQHIEKVKQHLGILGVQSQEYACHVQDEMAGKAQIDLLIDRKDNTISVCEVKFTEGEYVFSHEEEMKLRNRLNAIRSVSPVHKSVQLVFITTFGIAGGNGRGIVNQEVTLQDLLR